MILAHSLGFKSDDIVWEEVFNYDISKEEHLNSIKKFYELLEEYKNEVDNRIKLYCKIHNIKILKPYEK
jgi:hypothetical protein